MGTHFNIGDDVRWVSEQGRSSGIVTKIFTEDFDYNDSTHHATKGDPKYEIKSHMTDDKSAHKEADLSKIIKYRD